MLESVLEIDMHAHIANQLEPSREEGEKKDGEKQSSSHEKREKKTVSHGKATKETSRRRGM